MKTSPSLRFRLAALTALLMFTSAVQVWAFTWTDVPFPSEYVEAVDGVETHFLAHESDPDLGQIAVDSRGDHWAVTYESVYRLASGGDAWVEDAAGIDGLDDDPYAFASASLHVDTVTDKLFLFAGAAWVRGVDDTAWRPMTDVASQSASLRYSIVRFGGSLWSLGREGLVRIDPVAETIDGDDRPGLPTVGYDTLEQLSNVVATEDGLYVGVYYAWPEGTDAPAFALAGVYRLDAPDGRWVDTGLAVEPIETELLPSSTWEPTWGVQAIHATVGHVFASVHGRDFQANRLFVLDEATGEWSLVPVPAGDPVIDDENGLPHWNEYYLGPWMEFPVWDARLYTNPQPRYPNADDTGVQATFAVFDPVTMTWQAEITRDAVAWTPAVPADVHFVGDQILVPRYHTDYYDLPEAPPQTEDGFVASVPLPTQISTDPEVIGTNAVMALGFALLFGAISTVFNSILKENHETVAAWFAPLARLVRRGRAIPAVPDGPEGRPGALSTFLDRLPIRRFWRPVAIVLVSAVVYGFLDPAFGMTLDGFGLLLSLAIAIGVTTLAYEGFQAVLSTRRFGAPAAMRLLPAAVGIAVACVVVSRLMAFHPGYVFGIVGGLAFLTPTRPEPRPYGRMVLISAGALLAVSLVAWFAAVPVADAMATSGGFWLTTLQAALISVFVMGLEALLFGLLPIAFMDGEKVLRWSRVAWVAAYGTVAFAFWHVLLNPGSKYLDSLSQRNVVLMVALVVVYGCLTLAMYAYFRSRLRSATPTVTPGSPPAISTPTSV